MFTNETPQNTIRQTVNKQNIQEVKTTSPEIKTTDWKLKDSKDQENTDNKPKQQIKEVAQASDDKQIRNALGFKGDNSVKYLTWKKIDLKNIKENDFIKLKTQVHNIEAVDKNILKKYKIENIERYKRLIKDNIVKKYWISKVFSLDKQIISKTSSYNNIIITSILKISNIASNVDNYNFKTEKKCVKVFGKEKCSVKKYKYLKYKNWYIDYNIVWKLIREDSKKYYVILLWRKITNWLVYNDYKLFHKQFGWYGYKSINLLKIAIQNNNYKIMYLYSKYKINNLSTAYKTNIIWIVKTILWMN